ncbi:MAG: hypothetical protein ACI9EW_002479 [Cellvibrionaceae bacterium]|jgi:hypothetical protein
MVTDTYALSHRSSIGALRDLYSRIPRQQIIAFLLAGALLAFEVFNFDTTKFALGDLLGSTNFYGVSWAAILAFAFCSIDFAGLIKIFAPQAGGDQPMETWYLTGAWFLGATMNAMMTWYAVSLILAQQPIGTEVLSREQLLIYAPIFVAVLVWLTRILFIGSLSVAGEQIFANSDRRQPRPQARPQSRPTRPRPKPSNRYPASPQDHEMTQAYARPNHQAQRAAPQRLPVREPAQQRVSRVSRRPEARFDDRRTNERY